MLEFDSHRGEILALLSKMQKQEPTAESGYVAAGQVQFDVIRRGKKMLDSSRDKNLIKTKARTYEP